jgi:hypothetical protein
MVFPKIQYTINSEYHILRHFEQASDILLQNLTLAGYTQGEYKRELRQPGSKFFHHFATDFGQLLDRLKSVNVEQQVGLNGNLIFSAVFSKVLYPDGIGTKGVVAIQELTEQERARIYMGENRGYLLKHLKTKDLPVTNECTLILKPTNAGLQLITCFPGPSAMPVPDSKMSKDLYESCVKFWDEHVFLILEL